MENNFDLTSFLKKNVLLRENIGGYRDITPLKEEDLEEGIDDDSEDPFPSIQKGDSMIFDKGWQYDDDEEDFEDDFPDEREMFLGQGGQEILDNIKYLIDNGFQLEDIVKQIQQHANYFQGDSMEESFAADKSNAIRAAKEKNMDTDGMQYMTAQEIWSAIENKGAPIDSSKGNTGYEDGDNDRPYWA